MDHEAHSRNKFVNMKSQRVRIYQFFEELPLSSCLCALYMALVLHIDFAIFSEFLEILGLLVAILVATI